LNPELYLPFDAVKLGTVIPKNLSSARCRHLLMEKFLRRFGEIRIAVRIVGKKKPGYRHRSTVNVAGIGFVAFAGDDALAVEVFSRFHGWQRRVVFC